MSNEMQRRLKVLKKKITVATPCRHPLPIVHSDEEADEMLAILDACPRCSQPRVGPRILIIRLAQIPATMPLPEKVIESGATEK